MPPHSSTNFEIQKYYQYEAKLNGVHSRNNVPKIKGGAYVINLDDYKSIGIHWIALHVNGGNVTYFHSFRVEHISKEIKTFMGIRNITTNIFRIQAHESIICGYFCIGFINFMTKGKNLLEYTNLFFPNEFEVSDKIILSYFQ